MRFGENSETGSVARNENWMVQQKQKCLDAMRPNAVYIGTKRARINSELSRGHYGKTDQPEVCCHGLSKGLILTEKCFEFNMEIIQSKQCEAVLSLSVYD